jgi:hypothetical protein
MVQPSGIILGLDTMVMDNDDANKRQGVKPTYKKRKGFQPIQMTWGRFIIDAIFRSGDKHSNHGSDVEKMLRRVVQFIRKRYRQDVPVVIRLDSGFFDQKLFDICDSLQIGYICGGKLYEDIHTFVNGFDKSFWGLYENNHQVWEYVDFGDRRGNWDRFRRAIFCRPQYEDRQLLLKFARPDTIVYTNLAMGESIDEGLREAGMEKILTAEGIIEAYHGRGSDELVHRALKDFSSEQLPFKRFHQNAAYYYSMLIGFFVYEAFKEDVCGSIVPVTSYATTLRRKVVDVAGKITSHSDKIILKITTSSWRSLDFYSLWLRSESPVRIT